jgi:hypothetical protein
MIPLERMKNHKFLHRTNEKFWEKIQKDGYLMGNNYYSSDGDDEKKWQELQEMKERLGINEFRKQIYCRTYLSCIDWGESYGSVLLEVDYDVYSIPMNRGEDPLKRTHNVNPHDPEDLPEGKYYTQFLVFEPIPLNQIRRIDIDKECVITKK